MLRYAVVALCLVALPVLAGCLAPGPTPVDPGPPWTLAIDTTFQVCRHNHDRSRTEIDIEWGPNATVERYFGPCEAHMRSSRNVTDLPNGTPARGPDLFLSLGEREPGPGYDAYPNTSFHEPTWNYTPACLAYSPSYSIRAQHNRCDDHPMRQRVVVPPSPNASERAAWEANRSGIVATKPWGAAYPFTEQGELTLVLHRPVELSLEVWGEYPAAYKEMMRAPGACKEGVPEERQEMFAAGASRSWAWSMSGDVEYADENGVRLPDGRHFQETSNKVVVTGDGEITLAWQGDCIGGQY